MYAKKDFKKINKEYVLIAVLLREWILKSAIMLTQLMVFGHMGNNVTMETMILEMDAIIIKFLLILVVLIQISNLLIAINAQKIVYRAIRRMIKLNA